MKLINIPLVFFLVFFISIAVNAEENYIKINYGITNNDVSVTAFQGTIQTDGEDEGFMLSAGTMIGNNWGLDFMYYDLGSSSIKVDATEIIKIDNVLYEAQSAGTISNDISGYGLGLIVASNKKFLRYYAKAGLHSWDKAGSTTILDNDTAFAGSFYNSGIGGYGGLGIAVNFFEKVSIDIAYDVMGLSNDVSLSNNSSLLSAGFRVHF
jgi:hypothetical protein